jgi:predicted enzyme related to lactoylglutathione lyase
MTLPVTYVEINSPDLDRSATFFAHVFDWKLRPFADPGTWWRRPVTDPGSTPA